MCVHRAVDNKMSNFESKLGKYLFEFLHTKNESMLRNYVYLIHSRVELLHVHSPNTDIIKIDSYIKSINVLDEQLLCLLFR